ncbi:MAG TPA: mechanosensitive ion channel [Sandaracinaceae bacterium LLY-WYZ-13_1]|nr:mechanosensitive ion channel [Sandaracinaceae bacterium LLY-WYZ-13_1]
MNEWWSNTSEYVQQHAFSWASNVALGLVILVMGWILARLAAGGARRALTRSHARSLAPMASTLVKLSVLVTSLIMALDQMGFDVTTVLAGAGVLGLAVGFGAQTLVKDCISGFFLVVEDIVSEDDWVDLDGKFGKVENVGLRMTRLRSFDGTVWYVPNGEVKVVGNLSREWVRAIVYVGVAYEADLKRAMEVLQAVGDAYAKDHPELVYEDAPPVAHGALSFGDSSVNLRLVVKIRHSAEGEKWPVERALCLRIKDAFDREGIEIPFPRRVVYHRQAEGDAMRVLSDAA